MLSLLGRQEIAIQAQGVVGLSDLPVLALLLEWGQGLLLQVRGQRLAQGPVSEFVRLAHPADVVRDVALRDMSGPCQMFLKVYYNFSGQLCRLLYDHTWANVNRQGRASKRLARSAPDAFDVLQSRW